MKRFVKLVSVCLIALSVLALASCNSYGNDVAAAFRMGTVRRRCYNDSRIYF